MSTHMVFAAIAIICFLLAFTGYDQGKGVPLGLVFLTLLLVV